VELSGGLNTTAANAELLATDGDLTVSSAGTTTDQLTGDVLLRVGIGYGLEVGASPFAAHLKYSVLDERRHPNAPLSLAVTTQSGKRYIGVGTLISRQLGEDTVKLRPAVNLWYQYHRMPLSWTLPESTIDRSPGVSNPGISSDADQGQLGTGLYATLGVEEVSIPMGLEVPIVMNDDWDLVPFASYTLSIPIADRYADLQCVNCFAGLAAISLQTRSQLWVGLKLQPPLIRPVAAGATK
jgi:hypothetical protein